MSEFRVETVRLGQVRKHPNADTLSITDISGYPVIFKTGDFKEGDLATYISRDAMVPLSHPAFKFLDKGKGKTFHRVKAVRLRGVYSEGLLVPAIEGTADGDKVAELYGIEKYQDPGDKLDRQPQATRTKRKRVPWYEYVCHVWAAGLSIAILLVVWSNHLHWLVGTVLFVLTMVAHRVSLDNHRRSRKRPAYIEYDIDPLRKFSNLFKEDDTVLVTEKIHGCNSSFHHNGKRFHVKSRTVFREDKTDIYWRIAKVYDLERKLRKYPSYVLFGEIYGKGVQDLEYGKFSISFAAFDVLDLSTGKFLDVKDLLAFCTDIGVPHVPILYYGPYVEEVRELAEGQSCVEGANHVREGIVVRTNDRRVCLKMAGEGYLLR